MPRYRGTIQNQDGEPLTDRVADYLCVTAETFSGNVTVRLFSNGPVGDEKDWVEIKAFPHQHIGDQRTKEGVSLYRGPVAALHDPSQRDAFLATLAQAKLKKEYGT